MKNKKGNCDYLSFFSSKSELRDKKSQLSFKLFYYVTETSFHNFQH